MGSDVYSRVETDRNAFSKWFDDNLFLFYRPWCVHKFYKYNYNLLGNAGLNRDFHC